jgi:uncharacterized membrane protein YdbT with pleckstrin-like domain
MTHNDRVFSAGTARSGPAEGAAQRRNDLLDPTDEFMLRFPTARRRRMLAAVAGLILVTGLVVHFAIQSAAGNFVADALYTVMLFVVLSFIFVRTSAWWIAAATFLFCVGIELLQLTGLPASLAEVFPPSRLVLGTTFAVIDLLAYLLGALSAALVCTWRRRD